MMTEQLHSERRPSDVGNPENPVTLELLPDFAKELAIDYANTLENPELASPLETFFSGAVAINGVDAIVVGIIPQHRHLSVIAVTSLQGLAEKGHPIHERLRALREIFRPLSRSFRSTQENPVGVALSYLNPPPDRKNLFNHVVDALQRRSAITDTTHGPLTDVTIAYAPHSFKF